MQNIFNDNTIDAELILIDDGSTDSTLEIAKSFQEKHPYVTIISQKNGGQHIARNAGIDRAKGKYIYMMDDDDILVPGCLRSFLNIALQQNPDILIFDHRGEISEDEVEKLLQTYLPVDENSICFRGTGEEYIDTTSGLIGQDPVWNKLFKKETLDRYNLRFDPLVIHAEDTTFVWGAIALSKSVISVPCMGYYWLSHDSSCIHTMHTNQEYGNRRKNNQEFAAIYYQNFIQKHGNLSPKTIKYFADKRDSFNFAFWAFRLRVGIDKLTLNETIKRHRHHHIFPISARFPSKFYGKGLECLKFRILWYIFSSETSLRIALSLRNFYLKLFRKK